MRKFVAGNRASAADSCDLNAIPPCLTVAMWAHVVRVLGLPPQEARIVALIMREKQNKEIAAAMGLSRDTVHGYLQRTFDRVGVENRVGLVMRVFELCVGNEVDVALPQFERQNSVCSAISQFLLRDLAPAGKVRVIGNWTGRRVYRISVRGDVSSGDCQRIRNFMKLTLKG